MAQDIWFIGPKTKITGTARAIRISGNPSLVLDLGDDTREVVITLTKLMKAVNKILVEEGVTPPPKDFGSQVAIRSGLPRSLAARIDAIENR